MKQRILSLALLAALCVTAFLGCEKETEYNTIITVKGTDAKTHYNHSDHSVRWDMDDEITVARGNTLATEPFVILDTASDGSARFGGNLPESATPSTVYFALYPAQENVTISNGKFTCEAIKHNQTLTCSSFGKGNNTAVGHDVSTTMQFTNVGGLAKIAVRSNDEMTVKSIKIVNTGTYGITTLSGRGKIDVMDDEHAISWQPTGVYNEVIATAEEEDGIDISEPKMFYIVLPPCEMNSYIVAITDGNGVVHSKSFAPSTPVTIARSTVTSLGAIQLYEESANSFTVNSNGLRVKFSPGNLTCNNGVWNWLSPEYTYGTTDPANNIWSHFKWSTSISNWGMNTSREENDYAGDFVDWGTNTSLISRLGANWRTLTKDEWEYLFNSSNRHNSVTFAENDVRTDVRYIRAKVVVGNNIYKCYVLFPDGNNLELDLSDVPSPYNINPSESATNGDLDWGNVTIYSTDDWLQMHEAGCVFFPLAGSYGSQIIMGGVQGFYWSSSTNASGLPWEIHLHQLHFATYPESRSFGNSVRLAKELD